MLHFFYHWGGTKIHREIAGCGVAGREGAVLWRCVWGCEIEGFCSMESLSIWLLVVASVRLFAVYLGFFQPWSLHEKLFSKLKVKVQDVHGRTFGMWTLLTCLLCFMTAFHLDNEELYLVTFLSFVAALGYFLLECFLYHTMAVENLTGLTFFAGGSIIWMSLEWNKHHSRAIQ